MGTARIVVCNKYCQNCHKDSNDPHYQDAEVDFVKFSWWRIAPNQEESCSCSFIYPRAKNCAPDSHHQESPYRYEQRVN